MVIQLITEQTASHARLIDTPEIRLPANDQLANFGFTLFSMVLNNLSPEYRNQKLTHYELP